jgi:hypothetical protein
MSMSCELFRITTWDFPASKSLLEMGCGESSFVSQDAKLWGEGLMESSPWSQKCQMCCNVH